MVIFCVDLTLDILFLKFLAPDNVSNVQAGYYQAALVISRIPFFLAGTTIQALFPYLTQSKNTTKINYSNKTDYSGERWTVDDPEDYEVMENIINHFVPSLDFSWRDVLKLKQSHPE